MHNEKFLPYIDFHTHSECNSAGTLDVVSLDGTKLKKTSFYTIGYHPWWITEKLSVEDLMLIKQRYNSDHFCLGIGECGLDSLKGPTSNIQEEAFLQQIELANTVHASVVIHSVRAFDRILRIKRTYAKTSWVIHGFFRNKILAKQILDTGCYISVAPSHIMMPSFIETLQYLPDDRFFIETDSDFRVDIKQRYKILSQIRKTSPDHLKQVIFSNFVEFYKEKWKYHTGLNEQNYL